MNTEGVPVSSSLILIYTVCIGIFLQIFGVYTIIQFVFKS